MTLGDHFLEDAWPGVLARLGPDAALGEVLKRWAEVSPKPLVLLIDEIDTLQGDPLLSVLQQLRAGYPMRPAAFPQSAVLCGLRDVRDYRIRSTSSPFNIVAKSLRLGDFTREETLTLLDQHTRETGQAFTDDAREAIWTQTLGQPWLVNALAYETCFESEAGAGPLAVRNRRRHRGGAGRSHRAAGDASRPVGGQDSGRSGCAGWSSRC